MEKIKLEIDIEKAIRETLVIDNKQSIHIAVKKIITIINDNLKNESSTL